MERTILHCDLNNFFASVNLLYNQTLLRCPVAVAGDRENRHGIILAKNEIAKSYKVQTGEPIWQARQKCPKLIVLPPMYKEYAAFSKAAQAIYSRYTDQIEPFGIDECWLDVTGSARLFGDGMTIARCIKEAVKAELGITLSVGVSFNKTFAKLGSDLKKPDAVTRIGTDDFREIVWPLPVETLLFVGNSTTKTLHGLGIYTVGDLAACDEAVLHRALGKNGVALRNMALGLDTAPVAHMNAHRIPKSIGKSETTAHDLKDETDVWQSLLDFSQDIARQLREEDLYAGGVQILMRYPDLSRITPTARLDLPTNVGLTLARAAMELYQKNGGGVLRNVGLRAVFLNAPGEAVQQNAFDDPLCLGKEERLERQIILLQQRFGQNALRRGSVFNRKRQLYGP